jgi:hypothetical protein
MGCPPTCVLRSSQETNRANDASYYLGKTPFLFGSQQFTSEEIASDCFAGLARYWTRGYAPHLFRNIALLLESFRASAHYTQTPRRRE